MKARPLSRSVFGICILALALSTGAVQATGSGGVARPQIYLGAYALNDWINADARMVVSLYSASFFEAATVVDPDTGKLNTRRETETFSGWYGNQPYPTLALLAGISPGSIPIDRRRRGTISLPPPGSSCGARATA